MRQQQRYPGLPPLVQDPTTKKIYGADGELALVSGAGIYTVAAGATAAIIAATAYAAWQAGGGVVQLPQTVAINSALPLYSGGLGILAGDHLKAASDLGVPLVGVGLLYHEGYTSQVLNKDFWQQDVVEPFDIADLPLIDFAQEIRKSEAVIARCLRAILNHIEHGYQHDADHQPHKNILSEIRRHEGSLFEIRLG